MEQATTLAADWNIMLSNSSGPSSENKKEWMALRMVIVRHWANRRKK
jgi:hypothetical protein